MKIKMKSRGATRLTYKFLKNITDMNTESILHKYAEKGVEALRQATPKDTGKTADSWYYNIERDDTGASIQYCNSNINDGVCIAIIIEYGHGTGWGSYVPPHPYIERALSPIFNEIADIVWEDVKNG